MIAPNNVMTLLSEPFPNQLVGFHKQEMLTDVSDIPVRFGEVDGLLLSGPDVQLIDAVRGIVQ